MKSVVYSLSPLFLMVSLAISAQTAPAPNLGRLTLLRPAKGMDRDFEEGYKRHLEWHRSNRDPWTWHGWTVVLGDRVGTFVDASLGHSAEDLAKPVNPAGDSADNRVNTLPYTMSVDTAIFLDRRDLGTGIPDPGHTPLLQVYEYRIDPTRARQFTDVLARVRKDASPTPFAWWEIVNGGEHARFWLVVPAANLSEINLQPIDLLPAVLGSMGDPEVRSALQDSILSIRTEVLRYRAELSYRPGE